MGIWIKPENLEIKSGYMKSWNQNLGNKVWISGCKIQASGSNHENLTKAWESGNRV